MMNGRSRNFFLFALQHLLSSDYSDTWRGVKKKNYYFSSSWKSLCDTHNSLSLSLSFFLNQCFGIDEAWASQRGRNLVSDYYQKDCQTWLCHTITHKNLPSQFSLISFVCVLASLPRNTHQGQQLNRKQKIWMKGKFSFELGGGMPLKWNLQLTYLANSWHPSRERK